MTSGGDHRDLGDRGPSDTRDRRDREKLFWMASIWMQEHY
jgi:hypothetical protein